MRPGHAVYGVLFFVWSDDGHSPPTAECRQSQSPRSFWENTQSSLSEWPTLLIDIQISTDDLLILNMPYFSVSPVPERVQRKSAYTATFRQLAVLICALFVPLQVTVGQQVTEAPSLRLTEEASTDSGLLRLRDRKGEKSSNWLKDFGKLYSNPDDPFIQELNFIGRFHYQYGLVDGAESGNEVNYETDELRRFRMGFTTKALQYWDLYAEAEISDDQRPRGADLDIRFQHMWQLKLHLDLKEALGLENVDGLKLGLGSREINMSYEWVTSSKRIKTVERTAISNKIWAYNSEFANPTGIWLTTERKPATWTLGIFSTTQDDWLAPFNDGELYYSNLHWSLEDGPDNQERDLRWTFFIQDVDAGDEVLAGGLDWASALSIQTKRGPWEFHLEGILGNNGDQLRANREGNFWAIVVMPSYWIIDDNLEAVVRYQYQGSDESEGIRINSRYIRRAGARDGYPSLANGRGDEHHSVYMGLNRLISSHHQKIMAGVEYDSLLQAGNDQLGMWSAFVAYRIYW